MIDIDQLRAEVIHPVCEAIEPWSPFADLLMLGTALVESDLTYLRQHPTGPAIGMWQMETATHDSLWKNHIAFRPVLRKQLLGVSCVATRDAEPARVDANVMAYNLRYACAMARVLYRSKPDPLPETLEDAADYWKTHYNTPLGKGTPEKFIEAWRDAFTGDAYTY